MPVAVIRSERYSGGFPSTGKVKRRTTQVVICFLMMGAVVCSPFAINNQDTEALGDKTEPCIVQNEKEGYQIAGPAGSVKISQENLIRPKVVKYGELRFPRPARKLGIIKAEVVLEMDFPGKGELSEIKILRGPGQDLGFEKEALKFVKTIEYIPGQWKERSIDFCDITVIIKFQLDQEIHPFLIWSPKHIPSGPSGWDEPSRR